MESHTKQGLVAALAAEQQRWQAYLAGLDESQATAPQLPGGWSIKDVVAHLWAWQQRSVARLEAAGQGQEPDYPDWPAEFDPEVPEQPHDLNEWLYRTNRDTPWPNVFQAWRFTFNRLLALSDAVPEADLLTVGKFPWLEGYHLGAVLDGSREHHAEHWDWLHPPRP